MTPQPHDKQPGMGSSAATSYKSSSVAHDVGEPMQQSPDSRWLPLKPLLLLRRSAFGPLALLLLLLLVSALLLPLGSTHPAALQ